MSIDNINDFVTTQIVDYLKDVDEIHKEWLILKKSARCGQCSAWFYNNRYPYEKLHDFFECTKCEHIYCNNCFRSNIKQCWECSISPQLQPQ